MILTTIKDENKHKSATLQNYINITDISKANDSHETFPFPPVCPQPLPPTNYANLQHTYAPNRRLPLRDAHLKSDVNARNPAQIQNFVLQHTCEYH